MLRITVWFKCLDLSGQFISPPRFLSFHNKSLEQWRKRCRTTDKLQLSSAHRSFRRQTLPRREQAGPKGVLILPIDSSWLTPFILPVPSFGYALCKVGLIPTTIQWKGINMGIPSRPIDYCKLYNNRLCCLCLPIIQSVIIKCKIFMSP